MNRTLIAALVVLCALGKASAALAAEEKPQVAHVIFQDDQFFRLLSFGGRDAAKRLGVQLREGNSVNKLDKERQLVGPRNRLRSPWPFRLSSSKKMTKGTSSASASCSRPAIVKETLFSTRGPEAAHHRPKKALAWFVMAITTPKR